MSLKPNDSTFAGMLAKMIPLPFGRSRWVSRYFVLLDSELRLYKDPHTETPSQTLNLHKINQVMAITTTPQRPHCLQLGEEKPWIIDCGSDKVMEDWIFAIQSRIARYPLKSMSLPNTPNPLLLNIVMKKTNSYCSMQQVKSPEVYRLPTLPLRCTNLDSETGDHSSKASSLLSRRNMELTPLVILDSEVSCCSTSPIITTPSPTGAVIGTSYLIDEYYYTKAGTYYTDPLISIESSSPTYLSYKKRFGL
ncbi:hypothetical protein K501DRAFT_328965 [Backusella circina FSU 941]|nr:hypothetical protein K501DRAFT_328965 [Backusella circina FSU 941]